MAANNKIKIEIADLESAIAQLGQIKIIAENDPHLANMASVSDIAADLNLSEMGDDGGWTLVENQMAGPTKYIANVVQAIHTEVIALQGRLQTTLAILQQSDKDNSQDLNKNAAQLDGNGGH